MDLSIVLCTWNSAHRLAKTLESIGRCDIPPGLTWELVVVNNNSTDDTEAVIARYLTRLPINSVFEGKQGLSRARNAGLARATGRLILFTDDDVNPYPEWISTYWQAYQEKPEGFYFGGPVESEFEGDPLPKDLTPFAPWSVRGLDWGGTARQAAKREPFISANWACPREAIDQVGGFDPELGLNPESRRLSIGEESDLMRRLRESGWIPWYLPEARLRHFVPMDKCSVTHIAERRRAYGYYLAGTSDAVSPGRFHISGVPVKMCNEYLSQWIRYRWSKMRGRSWQRKYVKLCELHGMMEGLRDTYRNDKQQRAGVAV